MLPSPSGVTPEVWPVAFTLDLPERQLRVDQGIEAGRVSFPLLGGHLT